MCTEPTSTHLWKWKHRHWHSTRKPCGTKRQLSHTFCWAEIVIWRVVICWSHSLMKEDRQPEHLDNPPPPKKWNIPTLNMQKAERISSSSPASETGWESTCINPFTTHCTSPYINPLTTHCTSPYINPFTTHCTSPYINPFTTHCTSPYINPFTTTAPVPILTL